MWGLTIAGTLFCLFYHLSGRSHARAAFKWRQIMHSAEAGKERGLWDQFWKLGKVFHNKHIQETKSKRCCIKNKYNQHRCDICLDKRLPLPHIWIFIPAVFTIGWIITSLYLVVRLFLPSDPLHENPVLSLPLWVIITIAIIVSLFTIGVLAYIVCQGIKWWCKPIPELDQFSESPSR
jgi:hypothetical protein